MNRRREGPRRWRIAAVLLTAACAIFGAAPGEVRPTARAAQDVGEPSETAGDDETDGQDAGAENTLEDEIERRRQQLKAAGKEEERRKDPLEFLALQFRPAGGRVPYLKARHWTALNQELVANEGDFLGQLGTGLMDLGERTLFRARSIRMAALAKERRRGLELLLFPVREASRMRLELGLYGRSTLAPVRTQVTPLVALRGHQFFFVVLSRQPEQYRRRLPKMWSVNPNLEQLSLGDSETRHYQPVFPEDPEGPAPVSGHPLTWSSIAYVLWDDYAPTQLTQDQQHALLDWLHWGGQLIVSGHSTLVELRGSFLEPYLPAEEAGTLELHELDELSTAYPGPKIVRIGSTANEGKRQDDSKIYITEGTPLLASRLNVRPGVGRALFTTDEGEVLVAERRVGRGRVVVTAFRLSERPVAVWRGFDNFFNALVLRRPGRQEVRNADDFSGYVEWLGWPQQTLRPRLISQVRYFSRDTIAEPFDDSWGGTDSSNSVGPTIQGMGQSRFMVGTGTDVPQWAGQYKGPPVAEWDDFNAVSSTARDLLHAASGITVPPPSFVLQWVVAYLVLLVPVNWLVFRVIRRVELAWALVPVISLGFALMLLRTHLNIGFTRAVNEIDVVEAHADYPRGHLTRYTAVYTSTRTRYRFSYSDSTSVVLPFPTAKSTVRGEQARDVVFRWDDPVRLEQMLVQPNSLGMVHAEQMYDLKGAFQWQARGDVGGTLTNGTLLDLEDVVVVDPRYGSVEVGPLASGTTAPISFGTSDATVRPSKQTGMAGEWVREPAPRLDLLGRAVKREGSADVSEATSSHEEQDEDGALQVRHLVELARQTCPPGELRLVGWFGKALAGQQIEPAAVRHRGVTLVVVHLRSAPLPEPGKDAPWTWEVEGAFEFDDMTEEPALP